MTASPTTRDPAPSTSPSGADSSGTRHVLAWLAVATAVVVALLAADPGPDQPYAIGSEDADGTDVLRRVLVDLGVEVVEGDAADLVGGLRPVDVAVVFRDRLTDDQEAALGEHVASGGRVVVAAPGSDPAGNQGVRAGVGVAGPPGCDLLPSRALVDLDVDAFAGRGPTAVPDLVELDAPPVQACWEADGAALVATYDGVPGGASPGGTTVVLGDPDVVANAAMVADPDLAQLATLFLPDDASGRMVALVGSGPAPAATRTIGAVPPHLRRGMWIAALALVLYGAARARRHGRVLVEGPPVEVPASALAGGIAELLERHGEAADAASRLRAELRADVGPRLGAGSRDGSVLLELVHRATGLPRGVVERALVDGPVGGNEDLVDVAAAGRSVRAALASQGAAATDGPVEIGSRHRLTRPGPRRGRPRMPDAH